MDALKVIAVWVVSALICVALGALAAGSI